MTAANTGPGDRPDVRPSTAVPRRSSTSAFPLGLKLLTVTIYVTVAVPLTFVMLVVLAYAGLATVYAIGSGSIFDPFFGSFVGVITAVVGTFTTLVGGHLHAACTERADRLALVASLTAAACLLAVASGAHWTPFLAFTAAQFVIAGWALQVHLTRRTR